MPSVPPGLLIHRARTVRTVRTGERNEQGERVPAEVLGAWFPCRLVTRRPGNESAPDPGGAERSVKPWTLIWGDEDEAGAPIDPPAASDVVEVERELLAGIVTARFTIDGPPEDYDSGSGPFGGQADVSQVIASS